MRTTIRRSLATAAILGLGVGVTGCGADEPDDQASDAAAATTIASDDVAVDSVVGLEVTAVGNVSDVLSDEAIRIDRDGLGGVEDRGEVGKAAGFDYEYDYDYYDYGDLTEYDEDFADDDVADEGVLVVSADGLDSFDVDQPVRVSGTVRRFDKSVLESVYDFDLENDVFESFKEDSLIIVADKVRAASAPGAAGKQGASKGKASTSDGQS